MPKGKLDNTEKKLIASMQQMIPSLGKKFHDMKLAEMDSFKLLEMAQHRQINVKLQGPTGGGKTTIYEAYCESSRQPHFVANMKGSTTSEELIGAFVPNEETGGAQYVWKDGVIIRALKYSNMWVEANVTKKTKDGTDTYENDAPTGYAIDINRKNELAPEDIIKTEGNKFVVKAWPLCMLTVEEINFSPEELMSVWFSLLDIRRNIVLNEKDGEVIKAGKFLSVNATMNPDYIGTNPLNEALNDRFLIKLDVDYDVKVENKIIAETGKEYDFYVKEIQFLKKFVHLIRKGNNEGELSGNISTRMIEAFMVIKGNFGDEVAERSLINAFNVDDQGFAKEAFEIAKADSNTVDLTSAEMEGLDLQNFKGYAPPKVAKTDAPVQTAKKKTDCPF